jgi:hypothetical protein
MKVGAAAYGHKINKVGTCPVKPGRTRQVKNALVETVLLRWGGRHFHHSNKELDVTRTIVS